MCSIVGVTGMPPDNNEALNLSLTASSILQGRGAQSAGIAWLKPSGRIEIAKARGKVDLLTKQLDESDLDTRGSAAISHTRYGTEGPDTLQNAQPLLSRNRQIVLAHNGEIIGADKIRTRLKRQGVKFKTTSDSEVVLKLLERSKGESMIAKITDVLNSLPGAYALVILWKGYLIGAVDPHSFHPLTLGVFQNGGHIFASEDTAIKAIGGRVVEDLDPGQVIVITPEQDVRRYTLRRARQNNISTARCAFNHVYTCLPTSSPWGIPVSRVRKALGAHTFDEMVHLGLVPPVDAVVPMLDSGRNSTISFANKMNHWRMMQLLREGGPEALEHVDLDYLYTYSPGINRAHNAGRNFMLSTQGERDLAIGLKHLLDTYLVKNKRVLVGDDSLVRGTTARKVTTLLRQHGAVEVHWVIFSPRIIASCPYGGVETKDKDLLVATSKSIEEVKQDINADSLYHISLKGFKKVMARFGSGFCMACWDKQQVVKA